MTTQTNRSEDRLDRVGRLLEQLAERQIHTDNRMDRADARMGRLKNALEATDRLITRNSEHLDHIDRLIDRNAEQIARNSVQIAALSREIGFLHAAVQGHFSQSSPPAHQD